MREFQSFETGRQRFQSRIERLDLRPAVEGHDVHQVDRPAEEASAAFVGAVGDAFHFFEELALESAQEECVDEPPRALPIVAGRLGAERLRKALQMGRDLRRHEPAMLIAALVWLPFDVQHGPAGLRKAIRRPKALHGCGIGLVGVTRDSAGPRWIRLRLNGVVENQGDKRQERRQSKMSAPHGVPFSRIERMTPLTNDAIMVEMPAGAIKN
jgi:hypothetical protein